MSLEILRRFLNVFHSEKLLRTPNPELQTYRFTRRYFLRWLLGLPFLFLFPFRVLEMRADPAIFQGREKGRSVGDFFEGEELLYEIGVGIFKRAALGRLSLEKGEKKGHYMATLQAETLGVLGWVARYRVDTYRATMIEVDSGNRLRALSFEEDVKVGKKLRRRTHTFDYERNRWIVARRRKNGTIARTEQNIPPGMIYDDFLTASYNFRFGVYGEIERGKNFTVATFPRKGAGTYEVRVATKGEEEKRRRSEKSKDGKEYYIKLFLDPEITHSKEGLIEGWLSKDLLPVEGTVKDVILFGDVKGTLIRKLKAES